MKHRGEEERSAQTTHRPKSNANKALTLRLKLASSLSLSLSLLDPHPRQRRFLVFILLLGLRLRRRITRRRGCRWRVRHTMIPCYCWVRSGVGIWDDVEKKEKDRDGWSEYMSLVKRRKRELGCLFDTLNETLRAPNRVSKVDHNGPESITFSH